MERRTFMVLVSGGLLAAPLAAGAQQAGKIWRIGWLSAASAPPAGTPLPFRQGMSDLGYIEGRNVSFEDRYAEGKYERLPGLTAELVRLGVDVIVVAEGPALAAARNATSTIPIVMASVASLAAAGPIASIARPGGSVTGLTLNAPELTAKRVELLKEAAPRLSRLAAIPASKGGMVPIWLKENEAAARALGFKLLVVELPEDPSTWTKAFQGIREKADGLTIMEGPRFSVEREQITRLAAQHKLPSVYSNRRYVESGGLMSYGVNVADVQRRAAVYVDKILKGAKPGDLPIEQPTKFQLVINLKTAKALGL